MGVLVPIPVFLSKTKYPFRKLEYIAISCLLYEMDFF